MAKNNKITHDKTITLNSKDIIWSDDGQSFIMNYKWCNLHKKIFKIYISIDNQNINGNYYPFSLLDNNQIQIYYNKHSCDWLNIKLCFNPIIIEKNNSNKSKNQTYNFKYDNFENINKNIFIGVSDINKKYLFCGYKYQRGVLSVVIPSGMDYPLHIFIVDKSTSNNSIKSIGYIE